VEYQPLYNLSPLVLEMEKRGKTQRLAFIANLTDKNGYGPGIEAIGSQHPRAMVVSDQIQVNVNDWFRGVAAPAWDE
jgi:hypothetical protein